MCGVPAGRRVRFYVLGLGFRIWDVGFRVLGFRVLGFRVQDLGYRVQC